MRIEKIDILKGLAIILVVLGHAIQNTTPDFLNNSVIASVIYSFHMHLFMFLSGYVMSKRCIQFNCKWIFNQFTSLVVPIIVWEYLLTFISEGFHIESLYIVFIDWLKNPIGHYWFLWVLFLCDICFVVIRIISNYFDNIKECYIAIFFILLLLGTTHIFNINWGYLKNLYLYLFFFEVGYYVSKENIKIEIPNIAKIIMIIIWLPLASLYSGGNSIFLSFNPYVISVTNFLYRIMIALYGIICIWWLIEYVNIKAIKKILLCIGKYTKEIYITHMIIMPMICNITGNYYYDVLIKTVLGLGISLSIVLAVENGYLNALLFGKMLKHNKMDN